MPSTFLSSSGALNGPLSVRYLMIASAFDAPTPTSSLASVFASAVLMLTAPAKTMRLARANAMPRRIFFFIVVLLLLSLLWLRTLRSEATLAQQAALVNFAGNGVYSVTRAYRRGP